MQPEVLSLLHDIHEAGSAILELSARHTFEDYRDQRWLRSSIEREFIAIGEALNAALDLDPQIPVKQAREIVGLRNILSTATERWTWIWSGDSFSAISPVSWPKSTPSSPPPEPNWSASCI